MKQLLTFKKPKKGGGVGWGLLVVGKSDAVVGRVIFPKKFLWWSLSERYDPRIKKLWIRPWKFKLL